MINIKYGNTNTFFIQGDHIQRDAGEDVDHQDDGDTIANALFRDLLTDPHQEGAAGRQGRHHREHAQEIEVLQKAAASKADGHGQ